MAQHDNSSKDGFWKFCSKTVDKLKKEPYLICTFAGLVIYATSFVAISNFESQALFSFCFLSLFILVSKRMTDKETHAERLAELDVQRIEVEGKAEREQARFRLEERRLLRLGVEKHVTNSLPQDINPVTVSDAAPAPRLTGRSKGGGRRE